jgi:hypothetical protein
MSTRLARELGIAGDPTGAAGPLLLLAVVTGLVAGTSAVVALAAALTDPWAPALLLLAPVVVLAGRLVGGRRVPHGRAGSLVAPSILASAGLVAAVAWSMLADAAAPRTGSLLLVASLALALGVSWGRSRLVAERLFTTVDRARVDEVTTVGALAAIAGGSFVVVGTASSLPPLSLLFATLALLPVAALLVLLLEVRLPGNSAREAPGAASASASRLSVRESGRPALAAFAAALALAGLGWTLLVGAATLSLDARIPALAAVAALAAVLVLVLRSAVAGASRRSIPEAPSGLPPRREPYEADATARAARAAAAAVVIAATVLVLTTPSPPLVLVCSLAAALVAAVAWKKSRRLALPEPAPDEDHSHSVVEVRDRASLAQLATMLRGDGELSEAATALGLLRSVPADMLEVPLAAALEHPAAAIRTEALSLVPVGSEAWGAVVARSARDDDHRVRRAAVAVVRRACGERSDELLLERLDDPEAAVVAEAIRELSLSVGQGARRAAEVALRRLLVDTSAVRRAAGVAALPSLPDDEVRLAALVAALGDDDVGVVRAALDASAAAPDPRLVPALLPALGDEALRSAATAALFACGPAGADALSRVLLDPAEPVTLRAAAAALLPVADRAAAMAHLSAVLGDDAPSVRAVAMAALRGMNMVLPAAPVEALVEREALDTVRAWAAHRSATRVEAGAIVVERLAHAVQAARRRLVSALVLRYPHDLALRSAAQEGAAGGEAFRLARVAAALPRPLRPLLGPLLRLDDGSAALAVGGRFGVAEPDLVTLFAASARSADRWLRAAALHEIGERRLRSAVDAVQEALGARDAVVSEVARKAHAQLAEAQEERASETSPLEGENVSSGGGYSRGATARSDGMGLTTLERVLCLKGVSLFRDVEVETLAPVAGAAHVMTVPSGTRLIRTGDEGDCLYVVVAGEVSVRLGNGEEVARRGPGAVFGEMAVISDRPRSADCVALDDVTVLRVDRSDFSELMTRHPSLARAVVTVLAERLDEAVENLRLATSGARG